MRVCCFAAAIGFVVWPLGLFSQNAMPDAYVPPTLTLEHLMLVDPTLSGLSLWTLAADKVKFLATLEEQASSGKVLAQLMLGGAYIPPECTFLPFKTAPADCPDDPPPNNFLGVTPSFEMAIHWLSLAAAQGSGEASEMLAELIERVIKSPTPSPYQMTDVVHYHALARSQGFDLRAVEYSCYTLDRSAPVDKLVMADGPAEYRFTPQELDALHAAGASGTIRWGSANIESGITVLLQHPEGPKVRTRVILSGPIANELLVAMPDRVDVVFLQLGGFVVTLPSSYPSLRRRISFHPASAEDDTGVSFQGIDGRFAGGCVAPISR